jgi:phosphoribosylanthranilate isomerase
MPSPRLKVCCIASVDEARVAVAAGAHAVGLVGEMPSGPGPIPDGLIAEIAAATPPGVSRFLLSSRETAEGLAAHARIAGVDALQIVKHVDMREYAALRRALPGVRLVQVVHVEDEGAVALARDYARLADALLLDSGRPSAAEFGGTGRAHDWSVSRRIVEAAGKPVFLAGGLNAGNIAGAVRAVRPFGIDLCSGVRTEGALDAAKLGAFTKAMWGGRFPSPARGQGMLSPPAPSPHSPPSHGSPARSIPASRRRCAASG